MITPEMARQELQKRAMQSQQLTPEMARQELENRRQKQMSTPERVAQSSEILPSGLSNLYRAAYEIGSNPSRSAKVATAGALDFGEGLENMAATASNLSNPFVNRGQKVVRGKQDYKKMLGVSDRKESDDLLEALPLALFPEIKAAEGAGALGYLATKAGEGAIYGQAAADSPGTGALLGTAGGTLGSIGGIKTGINNAKVALKNKILSHISSESEKGRAFTPKETEENLQRNFLDINGNQLNPDIGTATNNSALSNVYKVTSRVPFSGGKDQRSLLKKSLREVEERDFMKANSQKESELQGQLNEASRLAPVLADENVALNEAANRALEKSQRIDNEMVPNLEKEYASANDVLNQLAPEGSIKGSKSIASELKESFLRDKAVDKENYRAVNDFDKDLPEFSNPSAFENYKRSYDKFSPQSESLKEIFGDNTDLGSSLSKEMKKGGAFLSGDINDFNKLDKVFGRSDILDKVSPEARDQILSQIKAPSKPEAAEGKLAAILNHARALQRVGAAAKASGKRAEAAGLFDMASSLKKDAKNILRTSGHGEVADQLESADKYYQANILPYYEKPEIRNTVLYDRYSPSGVKLSKELHGENQFGILGRLSPSAQKASLNQLLTKGIGSSEGKANFDTAKIRAAYDKLPAETKARIEQYNPGTEKYFDHLRNTKNAIESNKELSKHQLAVANTAFAKIKKNEDITTRIQKLNDKLEKNMLEKQKFLSKKFKSPPKGMSEPGSLLNKDAVNALKKTGSAAVELGLLGTGAILFPKTLTVSGLATALASRKANRLLTSPELLQKYLSGERYQKTKYIPPKARAALVRGLRIGNQKEEGTQ